MRTEGERVQYGDKICFVNVKFTNSYLFVSSKQAICEEGGQPHMFMQLHASVMARYEINSSASMSKWQIKPFQSYESLSSEGGFKAVAEDSEAQHVKRVSTSEACAA